MTRLLPLLLFPLLALGQTVQINQGAQTSRGIAPLTSGLTSINGDSTPAQTIQGAGGITVSTAQGTGVTTITGGGTTPSNLFMSAYSAFQHGWLGGQLIAFASSSNAIRATHFYYGAAHPVTFDEIVLTGQTVDATNGYALTIWDVTSNVRLCHSLTKTLPTNTAASPSFFFPCVENSVQLTPGHDYMFLAAGGGAATALSTNLAIMPVTTKLYLADATAAGNGSPGCTMATTIGGDGINCAGNFHLNPSFNSTPLAAGSVLSFYLINTLIPIPAIAPLSRTIRAGTQVATSYSSAMHGTLGSLSNIQLTTAANRIAGIHFHYGMATDTTFGSIYLNINAGDAAGSYTMLAIWDVTDQSATPNQFAVCHSHPVATVAASVAKFDCIEGSVSLVAGHDYILMRASTNGNATTAYGMSGQYLSTRLASPDFQNTPYFCTIDATPGGNGITCPTTGPNIFKATLQGYAPSLIISPLNLWLQ